MEYLHDIYDDLPNNEALLQEQVEKLQEQIKQLEEHIQSLETDIAKLSERVKELKTHRDNLSKNISELFKTAKAEIERKDKLIKELRTQIDQFIIQQKLNPKKRSRENSTHEYDSTAKKYKKNYDEQKKGSTLHKRSRSRSREKHKSYRERSHKEHDDFKKSYLFRDNQFKKTDKDKVDKKNVPLNKDNNHKPFSDVTIDLTDEAPKKKVKLPSLSDESKKAHVGITEKKEETEKMKRIETKNTGSKTSVHEEKKGKEKRENRPLESTKSRRKSTIEREDLKINHYYTCHKLFEDTQSSGKKPEKDVTSAENSVKTNSRVAKVCDKEEEADIDKIKKLVDKEKQIIKSSSDSNDEKSKLENKPKTTENEIHINDNNLVVYPSTSCTLSEPTKQENRDNPNKIDTVESFSKETENSKPQKQIETYVKKTEEISSVCTKPPNLNLTPKYKTNRTRIEDVTKKLKQRLGEESNTNVEKIVEENTGINEIVPDKNYLNIVRSAVFAEEKEINLPDNEPKNEKFNGNILQTKEDTKSKSKSYSNQVKEAEKKENLTAKQIIKPGAKETILSVKRYFKVTMCDHKKVTDIECASNVDKSSSKTDIDPEKAKPEENTTEKQLNETVKKVATTNLEQTSEVKLKDQENTTNVDKSLEKEKPEETIIQVLKPNKIIDTKPEVKEVIESNKINNMKNQPKIDKKPTETKPKKPKEIITKKDTKDKVVVNKSEKPEEPVPESDRVLRSATRKNTSRDKLEKSFEPLIEERENKKINSEKNLINQEFCSSSTLSKPMEATNFECDQDKTNSSTKVIDVNSTVSKSIYVSSPLEKKENNREVPTSIQTILNPQIPTAAETVNCMLHNEKKFNTEILNKDIFNPQIVTSPSTVNLTHEGEIPVLHISEGDRISNDSIFDLSLGNYPAVTSSPVKSNIVKGDLGVSLSQSNSSTSRIFGNTDTSIPSILNVSDKNDSAIISSNNKNMNSSVSRKRRRVVFTMID